MYLGAVGPGFCEARSQLGHVDVQRKQLLGVISSVPLSMETDANNALEICAITRSAKQECKYFKIGPGSFTEIAHRKRSGPVRDTPPYRAIPFLRDSIDEGGVAPICLVFIGYRASIAEIPLCGAGIAPPLRMLSKGERLRTGGGYRTQLAMLRHQQPHSAQ